MASRSKDTERIEASFDILKSLELFKTGTYVDIGANVGHTSVNFSKYFDKFICFEPNPEAFKILEFEFGLLLKEIPDIMFSLYNLAISNTNCETTLYVPNSRSGWGSIDNRRYEPMLKNNKVQVEQINIEARTLDSFNFTDIAFIKIDTEQHEDKVCEGMVNTLIKNSYPNVFLENKRNESSKGIELLKTLGYSQVPVNLYKNDKHNTLLAKQ